MKKLTQYLHDFLVERISSAVESTEERSLRIVFGGPPSAQLNSLFEALTSQNGCLLLENIHGKTLIPIYLVDSHAPDPEENTMAARCTPSYLVNVRNSDQLRWLALTEVGASTNASLTTTVNPIGIIEEIEDFEAWYDTELIRYLFHRFMEEINDPVYEDKIATIIKYALSEAWLIDERNKDKRTTWMVLENLFELDFPSRLNVVCNLGLPKCSDNELGSDKHLKMIKKVASYLEGVGLRTGLDELEASAEEDQEQLRAFQEMRAHLENSGIIDAGEFAKTAFQTYSPITKDSSEIPDWWHRLDLKAWQNLLENEDEPDPLDNDKLNVELVNDLVAVPKGLFPIVQDRVDLKISITENLEPTNVTIERSNGNAKPTLRSTETLDVNGVCVFTDAESIPEHKSFIKYTISADGHEPINVKVIVLNRYTLGVVAIVAGAIKSTPFKVNNKARDPQNKKITRYESNLHLPGMGSHYVKFFTSDEFSLDGKIHGYDIDAENTEATERDINQISENQYSCLIETDEECHYEFSAYAVNESGERPYRIYITAEELKQTGAISELDRLIMTHSASASQSYSSPRIDPLNCRAMELEMWMLESEESFKPLIFGPDYLKKWQKPEWGKWQIYSQHPILVDPRPDSQDFLPPKEFITARNALFTVMNAQEDGATPSASTIPFYNLMKDQEFVNALEAYLDKYLEWLEEDYEKAAWSDLISIHATQLGSKALQSEPYAVLMSPFHPIRLAWQCCAQHILQDALDRHSRCPAASVIDSNTFPDCFVLPCKTATGKVENKPFVAMANSSDYWSVLVAVDTNNSDVFSSPSNIFGEDLGISVEGIASGFSAQQVVRSFDEVSRLMSAKSTLRVGLSSDSGGSTSCNDGIDTWCRNNLGEDADDWLEAGHRSLVINDQRGEELQPEQAVLASLTASTGAAVRWFIGKSPERVHENDLSIIAHLSTMEHNFDVQGIRSAVDFSGLSRWRVRKQLPHYAFFIAESRIGQFPHDIDGNPISIKLMQCTDKVERQCRDDFDSYIFAPDMDTLSEVIADSKYTALSSSNVDAACFFGATDTSYLWDYELPSYSKRSGQNTGYYLLAKESPGMLRAVKSALMLLGNGVEIDDDRISSLLEEISRRGMPTLKRLTAGGTMSLGELGMLTALRILQTEFETGSDGVGVLPALDEDETINLVISADPFQKHFDDLRNAIGFKYGERPDLLVISIAFDSGEPTRLKLTPIEVKAREGSLSPNQKSQALEQASHFSEFLGEIKALADEVELWGIAWRNLMASMLDYSFRIYGQLEKFMNHEEWANQHSKILNAITCNGIDLQIDTTGRLVVIDSSASPSQQDTDNDGFEETILLNHKEALTVLATNNTNFATKVKSKIADWGLKPAETVQPPNQDVPSSESDAETTGLSTDRGQTHPIPDSPPVTDSNEEPQESSFVGLTSKPLGFGKTEPITIGGQAEPDQSATVADGNGIKFVVGETINQFTPEQLSFFPSNTDLNHLNVGVVGDLGTGKTQLIKALIKQFRDAPEDNRGKKPNILIFDYKRDYSKADFVEATGARVVKPFDIPLNLFDTSNSSNPKRAWLERTKFFIDVLHKIYSGIGAVQQQRIKEAVKKAYNESEAHPPTINDVFEAYKEASDGAIDTPYNIMDDLVDGEYFVSDPSQVIPFSEFIDGIVVIDLAEVGQDDRTKNMLVVIFLNLFYDHMLKIQKKEFIGSDPQLRFIDTMLLVDEADNIMKYEFDVLKKILLQGREFGVGVLMASQYLSHFKTSHENYLEPLLSWFIHKVPNVSVKELEAIGLTNVNADVVDQIKNLNCHECLFKTLDVGGKIIRANPFYELLNQE